MPVQEPIVEMTTYRLVLVLPDSRKLLVIDDFDGDRLPSIAIPQWTRPAEQLQKAIHAVWKLHVLLLEFLQGHPLCAVAEVLVPGGIAGFKPIPLRQLATSELSEQQRAQIASILDDDSQASGPFSRVGWINEAIAWLESETGRRLSSKSDIEQYNAGGAFALVRFRMEDDRDCWMKATGEPNSHEPSITRLLRTIGGNYLPEIISSRPAWNAWLMRGEAAGAEKHFAQPLRISTLMDAVESMAGLQVKAQDRRLDLLHHGAFEQGIQVFQKYSVMLFDYIEEAMRLQTSAKAPRLGGKRIQEIRTIFEEVCRRVEHLGISDSIVHGDLNRGNILTGGEHCRFIDWSEAYIGNPLIALQHLILLNPMENKEARKETDLALKQRYLDAWATSCDPEAFIKGFSFMPLLATASTLYGRGDWLSSPLRDEPRRQSYARTLARHMDRAARAPELLEALCH